MQAQEENIKPRNHVLKPVDIERALLGDRQRLNAIIAKLRPVIEAEVVRTFRSSNHLGRDMAQEVRDTTQEVFIALLADRAKVLRSWDPGKGAQLESFVRLVARRRAVSILRSSRRRPWHNPPTSVAMIEAASSPRAHVSRRLESADTLHKIYTNMAPRLGPRGVALFRLLYLEERTIDEVQATTGMSRDALYAWRHRLKRMALQLSEPM